MLFQPNTRSTLCSITAILFVGAMLFGCNIFYTGKVGDQTTTLTPRSGRKQNISIAVVDSDELRNSAYRTQHGDYTHTFYPKVIDIATNALHQRFVKVGVIKDTELNGDNDYDSYAYLTVQAQDKDIGRSLMLSVTIEIVAKDGSLLQRSTDAQYIVPHSTFLTRANAGATGPTREWLAEASALQENALYKAIDNACDQFGSSRELYRYSVAVAGKTKAQPSPGTVAEMKPRPAASLPTPKPFTPTLAKKEPTLSPAPAAAPSSAPSHVPASASVQAPTQTVGQAAQKEPAQPLAQKDSAPKAVPESPAPAPPPAELAAVSVPTSPGPPVMAWQNTKPSHTSAAPKPAMIASTPQLRTALVIGNATYAVGTLRNPVNDARDVASALKKLNFDVTLLIDANSRSMEDAIRKFGLSLRKGGLGLFYYAGHGLQVGGENYLVPIDARIETEADAKYGCVNAGLVLSKMEDAGNPVNVVILDACRNNPFSRGFRSADNGLAKMDAPKGSLIAYATAPGKVASDGTNKNGLYTKHLLKNLALKDVPLHDLFMRIRMGVISESKEKQIPWESSSLTGYVYLVPGNDAE